MSLVREKPPAPSTPTSTPEQLQRQPAAMEAQVATTSQGVPQMDNNTVLERYYEDAIEDPTMNSQPIEVYMYYAEIERAREAADPRPIPDAPWTALFKRCTGRKDKVIRADKQGPAVTEGLAGMFGSLSSRPNSVRHVEGPDGGRSGASTPTGSVRFGDMMDSLTSRSRNKPRDPIPAQMKSQEVLMDTDDDPSTDREHENEKKTNLQVWNDGQNVNEKDAAAIVEAPPSDSLLTPQEKETAYRLLRVASWQVIFFLIMTDVLGWYTAPMAFAMLGFAPGALIYTCFYLLAFVSGQILWRMYLSLDSERYPVKCYADLGQRTYGPMIKHLFNALQSVQLLFNVSMLLIMDGQALSQIIDFKFCYLALTIFFALFCMALAQAKTLRGLSWFTNINMWINIIVMTLTMIGVGLYDPVPAQSGHEDLSEPIIRSAWVPSYTSGWYNQVVGVQLAVFAYGGAMIFTEFMAEMRRPRDFWKAALGAQMLCWLLYMFFGIFVYAFQGQYTNILPTVNISSIIFQGVTNILGLICICIIAILYAHIGCKVFYRNILRGYFGAPSLSQAKSGLYWSATVCGYFAVAWVLGSAIPNITDLNTIVGATCILQFTYTFPPMLLVGHWVQKDALQGEQAWEPGMEPWSTRIDSWKDMSRWKRGFKKYWYAKITLIFMSLGCLALCALGLYSGIMSAKESFSKGYTTSFSCRAPGQPLDK